jgi:hypothetical protein
MSFHFFSLFASKAAERTPECVRQSRAAEFREVKFVIKFQMCLIVSTKKRFLWLFSMREDGAKCVLHNIHINISA